MAFEDVLARIGDEVDRGSFASMADKYPDLRSFVELGEQVSPVAAKIKSIGGDPAFELSKVPEWVQYRERNWLADRDMYRQEAEATDKAATLEAELNELRAKGVEGMTTEDLDKYLLDKGLVTKDALLKEYKVVTQDGLLSAMNSQGQRFQELYAHFDAKGKEYWEQFHEPLPMKEAFSYMETNRVYNPATKTLEMPSPEQAYQAVVAPKMAAAKEAETARKIEEARKEGHNAGFQEARSSSSGSAMPVGGGGLGRSVNSFLSRVMNRRAESAKSGNDRLGSGTATKEGYDAWQKSRQGAGAA